MSDKHRQTAKRIVQVYLPKADIFFYGSRAQGKAKPYSDLDILVRGQNKIEPSLIAKIKELMSASDLPFFVDVSDWHALSSEFQSAIESDLVEL